jgi:hypothetical protein
VKDVVRPVDGDPVAALLAVEDRSIDEEDEVDGPAADQERAGPSQLLDSAMPAMPKSRWTMLCRTLVSKMPSSWASEPCPANFRSS